MAIGDLVVQDSREEPQTHRIRFVGLNAPVRRLKTDLTWSPETEGRYAAALMTDVTTYFVTPEHSVFCNGLDGKSSVEETIFVFPTVEAAKAEIEQWSNEDDAVALIIYSLQPKDNDLCAQEVLRAPIGNRR